MSNGFAPPPPDVGFSPAGMPGAPTGESSGGLSSLFGSTPGGQQGPTGTMPSASVWSKIHSWLGQMDPKEVEKEMNYIQKLFGGMHKINELASKSQIAKKLIAEGQLAQKPKSYEPMEGGPTLPPTNAQQFTPPPAPAITPEMGAGMLKSMGLR